VAAGSGAAPEGLLPRRESLWLGEGWTKRIVSPLPCLRRSGFAQAGARGGEIFWGNYF